MAIQRYARWMGWPIDCVYMVKLTDHERIVEELSEVLTELILRFPPPRTSKQEAALDNAIAAQIAMLKKGGK